MQGRKDRMKRTFIPAEESFRKWKKDPKYIAEYDALEQEFGPCVSLDRRQETPAPRLAARSSRLTVRIPASGSVSH